jgi:ribosomal protein L37AE/L43A
MEAKAFDFEELDKLWKQKWNHKKERKKVQTIKRVLERTKYCPRCGSSDVFWASGLPQIWSVWECRTCRYRGSFIIEDAELAAKIREDYQRKERARGTLLE